MKLATTATPAGPSPKLSVLERRDDDAIVVI
jgi:hypothetical protein